MRRFAIFAFCILLFANCSRRERVASDRASVASVAPAANAVAAGSEDAASTDAGAQPVSAWTDPAIVARLEIDCAFDPQKLSDPQKEELFGNRFGAHQLRCVGSGFDQSCVYDPCFEGEERSCKNDCLHTCATCDESCSGGCYSCKAGCNDDACKKACAQSCAQCKQTCLTDQDHCSSGTCGTVYGECRKRLDSSWKTEGCNAVCTRFSPCRDSCYERMDADKSGGFDANACVHKCKAPLKTSCDLGLCGGKFSMGIEMK